MENSRDAGLLNIRHTAHAWQTKISRFIHARIVYCPTRQHDLRPRSQRVCSRLFARLLRITPIPAYVEFFPTPDNKIRRYCLPFICSPTMNILPMSQHLSRLHQFTGVVCSNDSLDFFVFYVFFFSFFLCEFFWLETSRGQKLVVKFDRTWIFPRFIFYSGFEGFCLIFQFRGIWQKFPRIVLTFRSAFLFLSVLTRDSRIF